ncbi:hypothetical protein [Streptomyces sp. M41(2017)]|uniref:hypothetical protein n=1 Tax=Streptomyces sp. M41(2017) TaxID=1955065 RepID=UPI0015C48F97|nr:hypothetical protein [Streptomyces sp. M41(2017)]
MARMYTCGFELASAAALMEWQDSNGSPAISQTIHRAGTASLRITPAAATQYIEHQLTSGVVQRTFHRFYLYITALPAADCNLYGIGQSGYFPGVLRLTSTGQLQLRDNQAAVNLGSPTAALSLNRWYRVELDFTDVAGTLTAGVSAFRGYLDGVQFADTLCTNINGFSRFRVGAIQSATAMDICIDDIAVNDNTGTAQNGLPGPGSVVHLHPAGAGDNNTWTGTGGTAGAANNWTRVNDTPPDDATTYNELTATGTTSADDFTLSSAAAAGIGASDPITLVAVGARIGSTATTTASIVTRLKGQAGGTLLESASTSVAVTGWQTHKAAVPRLYGLTAYTNPQTSAAWTRTALGTAQIGYRGNVSQSTSRRVSNLWALVEFIPTESQTLALPTVAETSAAQLLAGHKANTPPAAAETTTARPLTGHKTMALPTVVETTSARPPGARKQRSLSPAGELTAVQSLGRSKNGSLQTLSEANTAQPLTGHRYGALPRAQETSAALDLAPRKARALPQASETTSTSLPSVSKASPLPTVASQDAVQALTALKASPLPRTGETTTPQAFIPSGGLPTAYETTTARPLTGHKTLVLPIAYETSTARPLSSTKTALLAPVDETATAQDLVPLKTGPLPVVHEATTALPLTQGTPTEPDEAEYEVGQPFTTWTAGQPYPGRTAGQPYTTWETGQPW